MSYDFEKYYDRRVNGSWKWKAIDAVNNFPKEDVVPMTVADMDFPTCPNIIEKIQNYVATQVLGYSDPTNDYKKSVQHFFERKHNYSFDTDWLVTTPGIVPALSTAVRAFTKEQEGVIIMTPVYAPFYNVISMQNRRVEECPLLLKNNRYEIDFGLLTELAEKEDVKLIMLCSPHNPGGRVWTKEELQKIADIAIDNNLLVASDEIHSDIMHNGNKHYTFCSVDDKILDYSIICTAASKTFNIAGTQCSNIFIPNKNLRELFIAANLAVGIQGANVLGMVATQAAYDECEEWFEEMKEVITKNHKIVTNFFEEMGSDWKVMEQDASFLAWVDYSDINIDRDVFNVFLANDCDFYVNDGAMFGNASKTFIRINVGLPTIKLQENLERLKRNLSKNKELFTTANSTK